MLRGPLEAILNILSGFFMQELKLRLTSQHCIDRAQQPVKVEVVIRIGPFFELGFHRIAGIRPICTDLSQGQITFGDFRSATVNLIENIHNHIKRLVRAGVGLVGFSECAHDGRDYPFVFNAASFAAINDRMASDMSINFSHCSL